jgi:endonuclease G
MEMKNISAASIPLAIALIGGGVLSDSDTNFSTRTRLAATAMFEPVGVGGLTTDQLALLDSQNPFGIPDTDQPGNRTLVVRKGYSLAHNNIDLIADWVAFRLTREFVNGTEERPGSSAFKPDPELQAGLRAELDDYKGWKGVYDRGHQVASGDSKGRGKTVIRESFFLSNMTPQDSKLNQNKWRLLEERIQRLAADRDELWVVTGPVFVDDDNDGLVKYNIIGSNQVAVPTHYFKIVLAKAEAPDSYESMAFLIPNKTIDRPGEDLDTVMSDFLVSIDEVEQLTGLDFFPRMQDSMEDILEANPANVVWKINEH